MLVFRQRKHAHTLRMPHLGVGQRHFGAEKCVRRRRNGPGRGDSGICRYERRQQHHQHEEYEDRPHHMMMQMGVFML